MDRPRLPQSSISSTGPHSLPRANGIAGGAVVCRGDSACLFRARCLALLTMRRRFFSAPFVVLAVLWTTTANRARAAAARADFWWGDPARPGSAGRMPNMIQAMWVGAHDWLVLRTDVWWIVTWSSARHTTLVTWIDRGLTNALRILASPGYGVGYPNKPAPRWSWRRSPDFCVSGLAAAAGPGAHRAGRLHLPISAPVHESCLPALPVLAVAAGSIGGCLTFGGFGDDVLNMYLFSGLGYECLRPRAALDRPDLTVILRSPTSGYRVVPRLPCHAKPRRDGSARFHAKQGPRSTE